MTEEHLETGPGYSLIETADLALITLNEIPSEPGLTAASLQALPVVIQRVGAVPGRKFLVIRGEKGIFCRGASTNLIRVAVDEPDSSMRSELVNRVQRVVWAVLESPLMTVSFVNGLAAGPGAELGIACDITFADAAARVALWYNRLNILPDMGLFLLEDVIGSRAALRAVMTGAVWMKDDLVRLGFADPLEDAPSTAEEWRKILVRRFRHSPLAYAAAKRIRIESRRPLWDTELAQIRVRQTERLSDPELRERLERTLAMQMLATAVKE